MPTKIFDLLVIGKGPAGMSTAIYALNAGLSVLCIAANDGALEKAEHVGNYYGFAHGIPAKQLIESGQLQAKNLGCEFVTAEALGILLHEHFTVETTEGSFHGRAVVLAVGATRNTPNIQGLEHFSGKGVSYCAVCDAFFQKGKDVAVIGNGNHALHEVSALMSAAKSITLLTDGLDAPPLQQGISLNTKKIRCIKGDKRVSGVVFEDDSCISVHSVFVAVGMASGNDLARKTGIMLKDNYIVTNEKMETNIPGLYAVGDCTGGMLQIAKAVYQGATAAMSIIKAKKTASNSGKGLPS